MPRVTLYADKYIESDAVAFIEGKTRGRRLHDKDVAESIGLSKQAYSKRKTDGKLKLNYLELVKLIDKLKLSDDEIIMLMRGKC